jgi:hypothetical protein
MQRSAEKITERRLVYRALTGMNCKTSFAMSAMVAGLERFQAKWKPVHVKKTRQIENPEPRFDSLEAVRL